MLFRSSTELARGGLAPWQLGRVKEFVNANMFRSIRIEDLAAVTRLSTSYFRHAFRCSTGESPYAYILRRRMEHAQELMLLTDASLSQIALDCGFTDQPHLTRLFRRIVGVTPAAWRRTRCIGPVEGGSLERFSRTADCSGRATSFRDRAADAPA